MKHNLLVLLLVFGSIVFMLANAQNNQLEANKALLKRLHAAVSSGNLAEFDNLVSPDIVDHNPSPGQKLGLEGFKDSFKPYFATFQDLKVAVDADYIAQGDKVVVRHYFTGTQTGAFGEIKPTGRKVSAMAIDTWQVKNSKFVEVWHIEDLLSVVGQLSAAQDLSIPAGTPKLASSAGDAATNQAIAQRFYAAFNSRTFDDYDAFVATDVIDRNPIPNQEPGLPGLKKASQGFVSVFPDMQITVEDVTAEGDLVAIRGTAKGTHKAEFLSVPATGKQVSFGFHDLYRIKDGKILETWHVEELLQTLGFLSAK